MLLHESIDQVAASDPHRPALSFGGRTFTFGELTARTTRLAAALGHCTRPGDRVAILGENHPSWVEAYYGVPRAGRIFVFLNHRLAAAELAAMVERAGATLVVGPRTDLDRIQPALTAVADVAAPGSLPTYVDLDQWERMRNEQPEPAAGAAAGARGGREAAVSRHADLVDLHQWQHRIAQGRNAHAPQPCRISGRQRVRTPDRR